MAVASVEDTGIPSRRWRARIASDPCHGRPQQIAVTDFVDHLFALWWEIVGVTQK